MHPAMGNGDQRAACSGRVRQAVVAGIAIELQDAVESLRDALGIFIRLGQAHM